jgi:hypothetical protein
MLLRLGCIVRQSPGTGESPALQQRPGRRNDEHRREWRGHHAAHHRYGDTLHYFGSRTMSRHDGDEAVMSCGKPWYSNPAQIKEASFSSFSTRRSASSCICLASNAAESVLAPDRYAALVRAAFCAAEGGTVPYIGWPFAAAIEFRRQVPDVGHDQSPGVFIGQPRLRAHFGFLLDIAIVHVLAVDRQKAWSNPEWPSLACPRKRTHGLTSLRRTTSPLERRTGTMESEGPRRTPGAIRLADGERL